MGITLLDPDGTNFIKDWPSQNAVNCDRIDTYAGPCLTSHPLSSYTPAFKGATTDPVLGTGGTPLNVGYYYKIWDQYYVWGQIRFGTTGVSGGSGIYSVGLPVNVSTFTGGNTSPGRASVVGGGVVYDDSAAINVPFSAQLASNSTIQFNIRMNMGMPTVVVGSTSPIPWAANDGILWFARFTREGT